MNLHEILKQSKEAYIAFDRVYCPELCVPEEGIIELGKLLGKQERFFGNHLMKGTTNIDFTTGQRTIKVGDVIFTVAQFYIKTDDKLYRLADSEGFLNLAVKKNGQKTLVRKLAKSFLAIAISKERRFKQEIRQLSKISV